MCDGPGPDASQPPSPPARGPVSKTAPASCGRGRVPSAVARGACSPSSCPTCGSANSPAEPATSPSATPPPIATPRAARPPATEHIRHPPLRRLCPGAGCCLPVGRTGGGTGSGGNCWVAAASWPGLSGRRPRPPLGPYEGDAGSTGADLRAEQVGPVQPLRRRELVAGVDHDSADGLKNPSSAHTSAAAAWSSRYASCAAINASSAGLPGQGQAAPLRPLPQPRTSDTKGFRRRDRLGGLLHEYQQVA